MSVLLDTYNLLSSPDNPMGFNPDYVCSHYIPDVMPDGTKKENVSTLVLLTEIQNNPTNYASNLSRSVLSRIQIQVWFEFDDPLAEQYEKLLRDYLEANNLREYFFLVDKDPDLNKLFLTAKYLTNKFE